MNGKKIRTLVLRAILCLLLFGGGYAVRAFTDAQAAQEAAAQPHCNIQEHIRADAVQVRFHAGDVEWFNGVQWVKAGAADVLERQDPFQLAMENYLAFEDARLQRLEEEGALTVSAPPELPAVGRVVVPQQTVPGGGAAVGGGSYGGGGGSSGGGSGGGSVAPPPPSTSSGDGENMEWSDDYL